MSKHTVNGFITWRMAPWLDEKPEISFTTYDPSQMDKDDSYPRVVVAKHSFEVEVPDDFDPRPRLVETLRAAKERLRAEFSAKVMEYDRKINELLAIENSESAS